MMKRTKILVTTILACVLLGGFGIAIAAESTPSNIAKKSSIYAEVTDPFWEKSGYGTSALVDGKTGGTNYFSTEDHTTPDVTKELYFSFNDTYTISEIKFVAPSNRAIPKDFTVSVWNGSSWVEIANETGVSINSGATYVKDGINQTCTGIRIRATKLSVGSSASKYAMRFSEIEIMGVRSDTKLTNPIVHTMNVAKGISGEHIQFDCPEWAQKDFPKTKLVDGDTDGHKNFSTTDSFKAADVTKEIYLTLDDVYTVNELVLYPALQILNGVKQYVGGFPIDYTVSIWDGCTWREVVNETGVNMGAYGTEAANVGPKSYEFPFMDASVVRITATKQSTVNGAGTQWGLRLGEIQVNGVKSMKTNAEAPSIVFEAQNVAPSSEVTQSEDKKTVTYVFNKTYKIQEIVLGPAKGASFPTKFDISVWDGTAWRKVAGKNAADFSSGRLYLSFDAADCRAVRITSDSTVPVLNPGSREMEIRGVDTSAFVNVPTPLVNAAFGAAVEMECPDWAAATLGSGQLVDGKVTNFTTTEYAKDAATSKTVTVTFASAYEVSKINLYPRLSGENYKADGGFPAAFKVCVWDGKAWKEVKSVTQETKFSEKYPMLSLTLDSVELCNAVRIETVTLGASDNASQPYVLQLAELEVLGVKSEEALNRPGEEQEENTGVNAALNGTVTMNVPKEGFGLSFPAEKLVDGAITGNNNFATTAYVKDANTKESVTIVFKDGAYTIDKIKLYPRVKNAAYNGGFPVNFTVSVWNGSKWVNVATKTGIVKGTADALLLPINPTLCNAVKIDVTKMGESENAGQYTLQLAEVEAWGEKSSAALAKPVVENPNTPVTEKGTNAALNGIVTMNVPTWAKSFAGSKLVDGKTKGDNNFATTEYVANANTKETVYVAFKDGAYTIDKIKLYPRTKGNAYNGGFPVDFKVSVWNGSKWVEVAAKTGTAKNTVDPVSLSITPTVCNALKLEVTKMGESENKGKFTLQLAEIEAYGVKSSRKLAAAPTTSGGGSGSGKVTIDNNKNLALNKPVKASSDLAQYKAPITKVNDGNLGSYWASNDRKFVKGEAQWAEVNLLNNYKIHTVILGARQQALGFPIDFKIEVFYDGQWILAHTVKGFEANEKAGITAYEFKFPGVIGNKIRISSDNFRKVGTSNSMVLTEIAVYGDSVKGNYVLPNENMITVGAGITATTSMEDYDYYLVHLIDGNLTTGWSSVPSVTNEPQSVEVDMKCEVQLSEIQLKPSWGGHGFPIDFTISLFTDGKWVDVYEAKDYEKPEDEAIQRFQFDTKTITKFRITATKMDEEAGLYVWKMNEIMAYPSHTGDEFDPNRVEEVPSSERLAAAKVITSDEGDSGLFANVQLWKLIAGAILVLITIGGCTATIIFVGKKNKSKIE